MLAPAPFMPKETRADLAGKTGRPLEMKMRPKFVWRAETTLPEMSSGSIRIDEVILTGLRPSMMLAHRVDGTISDVLDSCIVGIGCLVDDILFIRRHNPTPNIVEETKVELIVAAL